MEPQNNMKPPAAEKPMNVIIKKVLSVVDVRQRGCSTITEAHVHLTVVNTEYAKILPDNTRKIMFISKKAATVYFSFTGGHVATQLDPCQIWFGANNGYCTIEDVYLSGKTIYFSGTDATDTVCMMIFT